MFYNLKRYLNQKSNTFLNVKSWKNGWKNAKNRLKKVGKMQFLTLKWLEKCKYLV